MVVVDRLTKILVVFIPTVSIVTAYEEVEFFMREFF